MAFVVRSVSRHAKLRGGLHDIKRLYAMRWGIETSFRNLKHTLGLLHLHAKKVEFVLQEITSKNASNRAKSQRYMQSEEFSNYAKLRNGVETVPANIRKNYRLDKLPRGKQRGKFFFGSKIAALNFRKLFGFRKGLVNYAQNPIFG